MTLHIRDIVVSYQTSRLYRHEKPSLRIPRADPDDAALTVFYRYAFQGLVLNEFKDNDE